MAQQTRLATIVPYFERWIQRFPRIQDIAEASEMEVTKLWEGLGYYRRALNIHKTARILMEQHSGQVPSALSDLLELPGIGRYTAGAILCLAFNLPEPAIDGNVVRLFSRLYRQSFQASRKRDLDVIDNEIRAILAQGQLRAPGTVAEALMGLGSSVCLPRIPRCHQCPVTPYCQTFRQPEKLTVQPQPQRKTLPVRHYLGLLLTTDLSETGHLLLVRNKPDSLLGGLWSFPAFEVTEEEIRGQSSLPERVRQSLSLKIGPASVFSSFTQDYSHFRRIQEVVKAECLGYRPNYDLWADFRWVRPGQLQDFPLSALDQRMAKVVLHRRNS